jgi:hypothetical protein
LNAGDPVRKPGRLISGRFERLDDVVGGLTQFALMPEISLADIAGPPPKGPSRAATWAAKRP